MNLIAVALAVLSQTPDASFATARADDVALLLHTSGTTSRPKLVPLTHANLCASVANIQASLNLTEADRCLNVMPLFHIHGLVGVMLSSLWAGASVAFPGRFYAAAFFDHFRACSPTWFSGTPALDADIAHRFGAAIENALRGRYNHLARSPRGALALCLLLDQMTRNVFRGTGRAFAGEFRLLREGDNFANVEISTA